MGLREPRTEVGPFAGGSRKLLSNLGLGFGGFRKLFLEAAGRWEAPVSFGATSDFDPRPTRALVLELEEKTGDRLLFRRNAFGVAPIVSPREAGMARWSA